MTTRRLLSVIPIGLVAVFLVLPFFNSLATFFSLSTTREVLSDSSMIGIVWFSLWQSVLSVVATMTIAFPATWALSRFQFPGAKLCRGLLTTPFVLPSIVVAAGVLAITHHTGVISILWAHVVFNVAVVLRVVGTRWMLLHPKYEESSATLGASPLQAFIHIVWPNIRAATFSAAALIFAYCFTSFGVISIVGGFSRRTIETEIFTQSVRLGNTDVAISLAIIQMIVVLFVFNISSPSARQTSTTSIIATPAALNVKAQGRWIVLVSVFIPVLVVILPLVATLMRSFSYRGRISLQAWKMVLSGTLPQLTVSTWKVVGTSLIFSLATAFLAVSLALIASQQMGSQHFHYSEQHRILRFITSLPLFVSAATLGLGLVITFNTDPFAWRSQTWLIPVIHAVIALPVAIRILEPAVLAIPVSLRDNAATLGASPWQTWLHVDFALLRPALLRGIGMCAAISLGEFGATSFLTRSDSTTMTMAISQLLGRPGAVTQQSGYVLASLLIVLTVGITSRA
jgi:thiamine transport system permease protein